VARITSLKSDTSRFAILAAIIGAFEFVTSSDVPSGLSWVLTTSVFVLMLYSSYSIWRHMTLAVVANHRNRTRDWCLVVFGALISGGLMIQSLFFVIGFATLAQGQPLANAVLIGINKASDALLLSFALACAWVGLWVSLKYVLLRRDKAKPPN
jgi:succinate dehydrogenase hydrophobic anchor subunit